MRASSLAYLRLVDHTLANRWTDSARLAGIANSAEPVNPLERSRLSTQFPLRRGFAEQIAQFIEGEWAQLRPHLLARGEAQISAEVAEQVALSETKQIWFTRAIERPELALKISQMPLMTSKGEFLLLVSLENGDGFKVYNMDSRQFVDLPLRGGGDVVISPLFEGSSGIVYLALATEKMVHILDARSGKVLRRFDRLPPDNLTGVLQIYERDGEIHAFMINQKPTTIGSDEPVLETIDMALSSGAVVAGAIPNGVWNYELGLDGHLYAYGAYPQQALTRRPLACAYLFLRDLSSQTTLIDRPSMFPIISGPVQLAWSGDGQPTLAKKSGAAQIIYDRTEQAFVPLQHLGHFSPLTVIYARDEHGQALFSSVTAVNDESNLTFLLNSKHLTRSPRPLSNGIYPETYTTTALEIVKSGSHWLQLIWQEADWDTLLRLKVYSFDQELLAEIQFDRGLSAHRKTFVNPVTGAIIAEFAAAGRGKQTKFVQIFGEIDEDGERQK